jgi:hypothetical protein
MHGRLWHVLLNELKLKEATNLVSSPKCVKRILGEFLDVIPEELPPRRQVNHAIEVMSGMAPPTKAPY